MSGSMLHSLEVEQTNLWGSVLPCYSQDRYHSKQHIYHGMRHFVGSETNSSTLPLAKM